MTMMGEWQLHARAGRVRQLVEPPETADVTVADPGSARGPGGRRLADPELMRCRAMRWVMPFWGDDGGVKGRVYGNVNGDV